MKVAKTRRIKKKTTKRNETLLRKKLYLLSFVFGIPTVARIVFAQRKIRISEATIGTAVLLQMYLILGGC